jgi:protoheme IX farnesyltransferase
VAGLAGAIYVVGAALLGLAFTAVAVYAAVARTIPAARKLFLASLLYLPALFTLLLVARR